MVFPILQIPVRVVEVNSLGVDRAQVNQPVHHLLARDRWRREVAQFQEHRLAARDKEWGRWHRHPRVDQRVDPVGQRALVVESKWNADNLAAAVRAREVVLEMRQNMRQARAAQYPVVLEADWLEMTAPVDRVEVVARRVREFLEVLGRAILSKGVEEIVGWALHRLAMEAQVLALEPAWRKVVREFRWRVRGRATVLAAKVTEAKD